MRSLIIVFIFFQASLFAQSWYQVYPYTTFFSFENSLNAPYLVIDSAFNSGTNWQIGVPQKSIFNSAVSSSNVIVTDSVNSYEVDDTSSFTITIPLLEYATEYYLTGSYYVDSDTLNDFGKIEYSHDSGDKWVLISDDTTTFVNTWGDTVGFPNNSQLPILTGKSNGWKPFYIDLLRAYYLFGTGGINQDTLLFKFSFISDSIPENRDGLMFDNLQIVNIYAFGLDENTKQLVTVFPNPNNSSLLTIQNLDNIHRVDVYSNEGKLIQTTEDNQIKTVSVELLPPGLYLLKLYAADRVYSQKFFRK